MAHPRGRTSRLAVSLVILVGGTCVLPLPDTGAPCDDDGDCAAGLYCEREFFALETGVCLPGSRPLAATLNQPAVGRNELIVARVGDDDVVGQLQVVDPDGDAIAFTARVFADLPVGILQVDEAGAFTLGSLAAGSARVVVDAVEQTTPPRPVTLALFIVVLESDAALTTWTGATSDDVAIAGNWSDGVPDADTSALIVPAGATPVFGTGDVVDADDVFVSIGAPVQQAGGSLTVHGTQLLAAGQWQAGEGGIVADRLDRVAGRLPGLVVDEACVVATLTTPRLDADRIDARGGLLELGAGTFTVRPTIDDTTPVVGQKLTASPGTDDAGVSVTYRWGRDDAGECNLLDDGSAGATYTVRAADLASRLCVRGSYSSTGYEPATRTSDPTAAVARGTLVPATPTIDDTTPTFGDVLTATQPRDGLPAEAQASFRWGTVSGTGASATCTTAGDPGAQHTVTAGEVGARLCVVSTVTADGYTSGTATSAPTSAAVEASLDAPTPTVVNTSRTNGAPRIDDVLEARTDTTGLPAGTRVDLAWGRLTGTGANATCTPTSAAGSTGAKYTVTAADGGSSVCVVATASRTGHTTDRASSAGTAVVLKRVGALTTPMVTGGSSAPRPGELLQVARPATAPQDATVTVAWGRVRGGACVANGATGSSYRVTVADLGRSLCATTTVGGPAYEKDVSVVSTRQALVTERARLAVDDRTVVGRQKVAVRGYGLRPGQTYRLLALGRVVERGTVAANGRYVGTYRFPSSTTSHPGRAIRLVVSDASGRRTFDATVKVTYRR